MKNYRILFFILIFSFPFGYLSGQTEPVNNEGNQDEQVATQAIPVDSSISTIIPKATLLEKSFVELPEKIAEITASQTINQQLNSAREEIGQLRFKISELKASGMFSFDKIAEIRVNTKEHLQKVKNIEKSIAEKINAIENLRQKWKETQKSWATLREKQADESEAVRNVFKEAEKKIKEARKLSVGVEAPLVQLQQIASELGSDYQNFLKEIDEIISSMRKDLFSKSRPAMFTPTFYYQFDKTLWEEFWLGIASLKMPSRNFYKSQGWVISLQFLGVLFFIWLFGTIGSERAQKLNLNFLVSRRVAAAIVAGLALFYPLFEDIPNTARAFLWLIMVVSGARVMAGTVEQPLRRTLIYVLAGLFLTTHIFYLIKLPTPAFRIFVAIVGLMGAIICLWRSIKGKSENASMPFLVATKIGGIVMLVIFLTQAAGYTSLSNHLLEVAIRSVFFLLIVWITSIILKGLFEAVLDNTFVKRSRIFEKHSRHIVTKVRFIVDCVAVYIAISGLLPVWGISDSTTDAAYSILNLGFNIQEQKVTVGIILTAIIFLYASLFASWLIQRILDEEVYPRKKVEPGVGISINRLIHYAFVIIGSIIALSTIGVGLQSLAVLMGAFGIGIGFGLQNIVNNFASGLILLFERSIKVGDVVQINGEWGTIKNLGLRATVVETYDRSELIVPNSDLVSSTVTNWTLTNQLIRVIVKVGVAYGSDVEKVIKILNQAANEHKFVLNYPKPSVLFTGFGNSSLDFEVRVFVNGMDYFLSVRSDLHVEIDRLFRENDVEIPFPQNDVHLRTIDEPFIKSAIHIKGIKLESGEEITS
ncbi:MAG: mechanosensitive ion channel domain-containing protein [Candidatus Rifleibacteriota bacterium]